MILDLCDIMNAEFRELADAGCPLIQVEEPPHHGRSTRPDAPMRNWQFMTEAFNRQLVGVNAEIWVHTCWGNPNQQRVYWEVPSYERAMPHLLQLNCDVITFECASSEGRDLHLFGKYKTDKKIGIGVVNHCNTVVEPPEFVAGLIRRALEYIPPERLVITTDCGFGREGLSRRIAYYKCVSMVEGTNIVRRELGLPEARVRAADPKLYFATCTIRPQHDEGSGSKGLNHGTRSVDHQQGPGCRRSITRSSMPSSAAAARCTARSACSCTVRKSPAGWRIWAPGAVRGDAGYARPRARGDGSGARVRGANTSGARRPAARGGRTFRKRRSRRSARTARTACRPRMR